MNLKAVPSVAWMRMEFVRMKGYQAATITLQLLFSSIPYRHVDLLNCRRSWAEYGITLNALLRECEWKSSNRAVFMQVLSKRSFTRGMRVARVGGAIELGYVLI